MKIKAKKPVIPVRKLAKSSKGPFVPFNFRLDGEHLKRAEALARRKGVTVSAIMQIALSEKLEREQAGQR